LASRVTVTIHRFRLIECPKGKTIISIIEEDFENKSKVDFENMRSFLENEMAHKLDNYYESIKSS
jgi:hypothetical protein